MQEQATKQKLCWNCEARVDYGVENCPSCGVYLSSSPLLDQSNESSSFIAPPYRFVSNQQEISIPDSPYFTQTPYRKEELSAPQPEAQEEEEQFEEQVMASSTNGPSLNWSREMMPLGLFLAGSVFSLFGLVLLLFSENGSFTLTWSGDYWYAYTLLGIPLLLFGWKALDNLYVPE